VRHTCGHRSSSDRPGVSSRLTRRNHRSMRTFRRICAEMLPNEPIDMGDTTLPRPAASAAPDYHHNTRSDWDSNRSWLCVAGGRNKVHTMSCSNERLSQLSCASNHNTLPFLYQLDAEQSAETGLRTHLHCPYSSTKTTTLCFAPVPHASSERQLRRVREVQECVGERTGPVVRAGGL